MISLTAATLSGCATCIKDFQKKHRIFQMDVTNKICNQYRIEDFLKDKYVWEKAHPIAYCHGFFGVSPEAFNDARNCAQSTAKDCR